MKKLSSVEIRQMFLDFFASKGHMIEPGASLVPINDPSLLWINAGVAALKKYFDGREKPNSNRIANAQKCIRTNDIENVGKTARHHTFFEMLGNFSIGDYFKEDALKFAYEFLTSPDYIGFDPKKMYVTVYIDDAEAYRIWTEVIGFDPTHILKTPENYWEIGEGPSGPDSEIYIDRGPKYDPQGLGEKLFFEEMENDRYIEVWNIVFSQYDAKEGVDRKDYKELPQKNIDTGMGLERLVALVQEGDTNYDTDLFLPIIHEIEKYAKAPYSDDKAKMAYRVIADHIRTITFALSDGASFSNEGRGYVLRRVLRRAARFNLNLGINEPFMYKLVDIVVENNKVFYPYLKDNMDKVKQLIRTEEEAFYKTLRKGEKLLDDALKEAEKTGILAGETIFTLYDTYGFPKEITIEAASDLGYKVDIDGFNACMERQKEMARNARSNEQSMHNQSKDLMDYEEPFEFLGYSQNECDATVKALFVEGKRVDGLTGEGDIIFDQSVFYAESGGQIADTGSICNDNLKMEVKNVIKAPHGAFLHHVIIEKGSVKEGDKVSMKIDADRRTKIRANHSSLHLLQSALREVLGTHVHQAGSYVSDTYARFDFNHYQKVEPEELEKIEGLVNEYIQAAYPIETKVLPVEEARKEEDVIALFDEKYEDLVRVVSMGTVSKEFCGGTHASNTADLNLFKIVSEDSIGSGIRRIECVTKNEAYKQFKEYQHTLNDLAAKLKLKSINAIDSKIDSLLQSNASLSKEIGNLNTKLNNLEADSLKSEFKQVNGISYLIKTVKYDGDLRDFASSTRDKVDRSLVFFAREKDGKYNFACAIDKQITDKFKAGDIVKYAASLCGGNGGGKPDLAMAGANANGKLDEVLSLVENKIREL